MTFLFFALFFVCTLGCFLIFDLVIKAQYERYRDEWVKDGMPHGFLFFRPKEAYGILGMPKFTSWTAMQARVFALTFTTPAWIAPGSNLRKLVWMFRLLQLLALASWLGFLVTGFI